MFLITKLIDYVKSNSIQNAMTTPHWLTNMDEEISALNRNRTWDLVPFSTSYNLVGNNWVFKVKHNVDGSMQIYKAGLVAKGFTQTPGIDFSETFIPVVKALTIIVILTIVVSRD